MAAPNIEVTPITWDMIGLDSNTPVTAGPNMFPVGVRACNTGPDAATNAMAKMHWDSENALIDLEGGVDTAALGDIAGGTCKEIYFNAVIDRGSVDGTQNPAFGTSRRYHITVAADGVSPVSTPTPRQLYVESLVSQNRNSVVAIRGGNCDASATNFASCDAAPGTDQPGAAPVVVGGEYTYTLYTNSATAYDEVSSFISFPSAQFQIIEADSTYSVPPSDALTSDSLWGDGCTWDSNPLSPGYADCTATGDRGGDTKVTYRVRIVGGGTATVNTLVNDFSGSSYHYNSDYGSGDGTFTITAQVPLTTEVTGFGNVTSNVGTINCGAGYPRPAQSATGVCTDTYDANTVVTLTAEALPGDTFVGWGGACQSASPQPPTPGPYTCAVTMDRAQYVTAAFEPVEGSASEWPLYVFVDGLGTVTSDTGGIDCTQISGPCTSAYNASTLVTLTATVPPGQTFAGWGGACSGTSLTCEVTMDQLRNVSATFLPSAYTVQVSVTGAGSGSVTADPGPINDCTGSGAGRAGAAGICSGTYTENALVTFTSTPAPGSRLQTWAGDLTGCTPDPTGDPVPAAITCPITGNRTVIAQYGLEFPLTVTVTGTGSGSVSSGIGAISDCTATGGTCTDAYPQYLSVPLTATPTPGSTFTGWSGDTTGCSTNPPDRPAAAAPNDVTNELTIYCIMGAARTITATFTLDTPPPAVTYPLTVTVQGPGSVNSAPAGITGCTATAGDCTERYDAGTFVTLTATPSAGSTFLGWSGVTCQPTIQSTASTCTVLMSQAQNAAAQFSVPVSVEIIAPPGSSGNRVSAPGVECTGGVCTSTLPPGSRITLTATPGPGQVFLGWGGVCAGTQSTCTITVEQLAQVQASFGVAPYPTLSLTTRPSPIRSGRTTTLTVRWANPTATPVGAATITVKLPKGVTFRSSTCNIEVTGRTLQIAVADLPANGLGSCRVVLRGVSAKRSVKAITGVLTPAVYPTLGAADTARLVIRPARRAPVTG